MDLCLKAYGQCHMLYVRLCLNIGILYEDDRDYNKAYDYFLKWNTACMEVSSYSNNSKSRFYLPSGRTHMDETSFYGNLTSLNYLVRIVELEKYFY